MDCVLVVPSLQIIKQHRDNGVWSHPNPAYGIRDESIRMFSLAPLQTAQGKRQASDHRH